MCIYIYIYIYLCMYTPAAVGAQAILEPSRHHARRVLIIDAIMPNLPTNIVDFRGFDSSIIVILRGGILRPIGDFPESLS